MLVFGEPAYEVGQAMNRNHEFVLGIDVSKRKLDVALLREGKTRSKVVENTTAGHEQLEAWLHVQGADARNTHVCMESTGPYGELIALRLSDGGWWVSVLNPAQVKGYAQGELLRNKTDRGDAALLARFCERMRPPRWIAPSAQWRQLRVKVDRIEALKQMRQQERNRLEAHQAGRSEELAKSVQEHLDWLDRKIAELQADIDEHIDRHPDLRNDAELMNSITGVGTVTTMKLLGHLGDIRRFHSAKALAVFVGVSPQRRESGTSIRGRSTISRSGNPTIRHALYMPGLVARHHNPILKEFGDRLAARGMAPKAVIGAVMRKLVHLIYAIVKSGHPFEPEFRRGGLAIQDGI